MADPIPDPGRHRTLFYGHDANRTQGARPDQQATQVKREQRGSQPDKEPSDGRRSSSSWARLIYQIYHVSPLTCRQCDHPLSISVFLTDSRTIRKILDPHGLSPPPPLLRDVRLVPVDEEGREIEGV